MQMTECPAWISESDKMASKKSCPACDQDAHVIHSLCDRTATTFNSFSAETQGS